MSERIMQHPSDELLVSFIGGELEPAAAAAVREHLDACGACARAAREFAHVDELLRHLPPLATAPDFAARTRARLLMSSAGTSRWRQAAAAIVLVAVGLGTGWAVARPDRSMHGAPIVRNSDGPKFALIFAEDPATLDVPADEHRRRYEEFLAWMRSIGDGTVRLGGSELDVSAGRVVGAAATTAVSPLVLSGFLVVEASSYDEAARHAERCPIVGRGGQVIVRQLR